MKQAWKTTLMGIRSVVAAESPGKAAAATLRQAREAGYPCVFTAVRVIRSPSHDAWAALDSTGVAWDETLLPAA